MKKESRVEIRLERYVKKYLTHAADFDHKTLSGLLVHAAMVYADQLRARGWTAKPAPTPRDARRKAVRGMTPVIPSMGSPARGGVRGLEGFNSRSISEG
jgi:hypothetical protein